MPNAHVRVTGCITYVLPCFFHFFRCVGSYRSSLSVMHTYMYHCRVLVILILFREITVIMMLVHTGGPPAYTATAGYPVMPQQQMGSVYNPSLAAASAPHLPGYELGDVMPPTKM